MILTKRYLPSVILLLFLALGIHAGAQNNNPNYNKQLADSLGGDDYGMKRYVLVLLKTGTATTTDKTVTDSLFRGHMLNINRLAEGGKLIVAGPLQKNERAFRGIFILNVSALDEARELLFTDPAIKAKLLGFELYSWYGSAALPMYLKFHEQVERKTF